MIESIAYNCRKLTRNGLIHGCFSRNGIIRMKHEERARPVKIFRIDKLCQFFPDFDFGDADEDDDIFLDTFQVVINDSVQCSYSITSFIYILDIFARSINESICEFQVF